MDSEGARDSPHPSATGDGYFKKINSLLHELRENMVNDQKINNQKK